MSEEENACFLLDRSCLPEDHLCHFFELAVRQKVSQRVKIAYLFPVLMFSWFHVPFFICANHSSATAVWQLYGALSTTCIPRCLRQLLVSVLLWYAAPSKTNTVSSLHPTPYFEVRQAANRDRNNCITFSSVLHQVNANQTQPSDETATIIFTLCPSTLSAIELFCPRVPQRRLRKSVCGIHDSSMLMTCFPSLQTSNICFAYRCLRTKHLSELPYSETRLIFLQLSRNWFLRMRVTVRIGIFEPVQRLAFACICFDDHTFFLLESKSDTILTTAA